MEKNENPPSYLIPRCSNAKRVLTCVFFYQKPIRVDEICKITGLKKTQVYESLRFLYSLRSIKKKYYRVTPKKMVPPSKILEISIDKSHFNSAKRWIEKK